MNKNFNYLEKDHNLNCGPFDDFTFGVEPM